MILKDDEISESRKEIQKILSFAAELRKCQSLPSIEYFRQFLKSASENLWNLPLSIRHSGENGVPGGIVECNPEYPVLIIPDIHGRIALIEKALLFKPPEMETRMIDALYSGKACMLILGDILHSETGDAPLRWAAAFQEYLDGFSVHSRMDEEMIFSLSSLELVFILLSAFPENFFCLKGNHDNAANRSSYGDMPFGKFAYEGEMTAAWLKLWGGNILLEELVEYERRLPLVARGNNFCASHSEPAFDLDEKDINSYRNRPEIVQALIWTNNDAAQIGSVENTLNSLLGNKASQSVWISGHRPVADHWAIRQQGKLVQIHAPNFYQAAWIRPGRKFNPQQDIHDLNQF